jgi:hypothetical protein
MAAPSPPKSRTSLPVYASQAHERSNFPHRRHRTLHVMPASLLLSTASAYFPSPRGCTSKPFPTTDFQALKRTNSFVCIGLPLLCPLFPLFSALAPFVFNRLQPLFPKHPGGGVPLRRALHRQPRRARNGNGKSYLLPIGAQASYQERGILCLSRRAHTFMRLAQTTFFYEWLAGLFLCAREQSVPRLTVLLNRGMLRWCGWLLPNKDGRLPRQHWDRTSRFVPPKTARIWFIKSIPRRGTNTLTRVRSICTPGTAIFAASDTRRRET